MNSGDILLIGFVLIVGAFIAGRLLINHFFRRRAEYTNNLARVVTKMQAPDKPKEMR